MKKLQLSALLSAMLMAALPSPAQVYGCMRTGEAGTCMVGGDPSSDCTWCWDAYDCSATCGCGAGDIIIDPDGARCIVLC